MRKPLIFIIILLSVYASSCQLPPPIAQMDANVSLSTETMTNQSAFASVNFTQVTKEIINNQTILQFSNDDGYAIQFQLITSSLNAQTYDMSDGNSMSGTFNFTVNGQRLDIQVVSTGQGSLNVTSVTSTDNAVSSMQGSFVVNIASTGNEDATEATGVVNGIISF
jgi:hypothetical protein